MTRDPGQIQSDATKAISALIQEAFEAGRLQGRLEAGRDLKSKIDRLLIGESDPPNEPQLTEPGHTVPRTVSPERIMELVDRNEKRATPGSVKPTVLHLVQEADSGISQEEIAQRTGFKFNSIRGTLWTLGNEKVVEKRGNLWFAKSETSGFVDVYVKESAEAATSLPEPDGEYDHVRTRQRVRTVPADNHSEKYQNTETAEQDSSQKQPATSGSRLFEDDKVDPLS